MNKEICSCSSLRHKERAKEERERLLRRLARIEGQVRGIRDMVKSDAYCPDVLVQISAASAALSALSRELLSSHIKTCVVKDISEGKEEAPDELARLVERLLKK